MEKSEKEKLLELRMKELEERERQLALREETVLKTETSLDEFVAANSSAASTPDVVEEKAPALAPEPIKVQNGRRP